jgi:RHS repeat-associated protein
MPTASPGPGAPVALDDLYAVAANDVLTVPAGGVLENDTDPNLDPLGAMLLRSPASGSLELAADGSFTYDPLGSRSQAFVYCEDFQDASAALSEWSTTTTTTTSGRRFLGRFGNEGVRLSLAGLPAHAQVTVSFNLLAIGSWEGNSATAGPDAFSLALGDGGPTLVNTTFSNVTTAGNDRQAYPDAFPGGDNPARTGASEVNPSGFQSPTSIYALAATFAHADPTLALDFAASGLEALANESWGIDNVCVSIGAPLAAAVEWSHPGFLVRPTSNQVMMAPVVADMNMDGVPDVVFNTFVGSGYTANGTLRVVDGRGETPALANLVRAPGVTINASSELSAGFAKGRATDGDLKTSWFTARPDTSAFLEVVFPSDVTVRRIRYFGNREFPNGFDFLSGIFQAFDASGSELYDSGEIDLPAPSRDVDLDLGAIAGVRRVRFSATASDRPTSDNGFAELEVWGEGLDAGPEIWAATDEGDDVYPGASVAVGDIDRDGLPEVIAVHEDDTLVAFEHDGRRKWKGTVRPWNGLGYGGMSIADLDQDGAPEIVAGASAFNADGTLRWSGNTAGGTGWGSNGAAAQSTVADIDLDGRPEVIAGRSAYRYDGSLYWNAAVGDGYAAVANLDADPQAEVVLVSAGNVYVLEHTGTVKWGPKDIPGGGAGGPPTVADVDGDGELEIGVAGATRYCVLETDGSIKWCSVTQDGSSNRTGSSVFDFDGDRTAEVIYADELVLRIYRGATGEVLFSTSRGSGTTLELPVVADVDADGHAEIVIGANDYFAGDETGLLVIGGTDASWVSTRRIWNQHDYHVTNVNEDASIPRVERPNWLVGGLNHFRLNSFSLDDQQRMETFAYKAVDPGGLASEPATVTIEIRAPNGPPEIVSEPPLQVAASSLYRYVVQATDPDAGDELRFALVEAPAGMTIASDTGVVEWLPGSEAIGANEVRVLVQDRRGLTDTQSFTLEVVGVTTCDNARVDGVNVPGTSDPWLAGMPDGSLASSGDVAPTHSPALVRGLNLAAGGVLRFFVTGCATNAGATCSGNPDGTGGVAHGAGAENGIGNVFAPVNALIGVFLGPERPNLTPAPAALDFRNPPSGLGTAFTTLAPLLKQPFFIGDGLTATGSGSFQEFAVPPGATRLYLGPMDGFGWFNNGGTMVAEISQLCAGAATPTPVPSQTPGATATGPTATPDRDDDGDGFSESQGDCDDGDASVFPGAPDPSGDGIDQNCDGADGGRSLVEIVVEPAAPIVLAGDSQAFTATGVYDDGTSSSLTTSVTWSSGASDVASIAASGVASALAAGTTTITAMLGTISGTTTLTVGAQAAGDTTPPVAQISSPEANAEVTAPVEVLGTATDDNFLEYELAIAPVGDATFTVLTTGAAPVANGVLGRLDPTLLVNDQYTIRLTVFDRGGNETTAQTVIQVAEQMKIGNFSLTFTDLVVPLSGVPLAVRRVYDSRDKRRGDFGVGWRLELQSIRVRANRVLGTGWVRNRSGINVVLSPTDAHKVSVTLPNGRVEEFDMRVSPTQRAFSLDATTVTGFTPRAGTIGRLEALANGSVFVLNAGAEDELVDDTTFNTYDPVRYRYTAPDGTRFVIHVANGLETVTDPNGNTLTFGASGITHSAAKGVTFVRDAFGRIVSLTDPKGNVQTYTYDANGDLVGHRDAGGNTSRFEYDRRHGLLRVIDPLDRTVGRNEYDDDGRLIATTGANGRRIEFQHDLDARREVVTDIDGSTTVLEYDAAGRVLRVTDPLGGVTSNTYDAAGNQTSVTNAEGETTTRTFDARGNKLTETNALGETVRYAYNARDQITSVTDAEGHTTTIAYDARGNLLTRSNALGVVEETNTYDARGNLLTRTDAVGGVTTYEYDSFGNPVGVVDPRGNRAELAFDANGNVVTDRDRRGSAVTAVFDARNLFTTMTDPRGATSAFVYDALGELVGVTDPSGSEMRLTVDAQGRDLAYRNELGGTTTRDYDLKGNVTRIVDLGGNATGFEYDELERRTKVVHPGGAEERFAWDRVGRNVSRTDANGNTTTFAYDDTGRLVRLTDALAGVTTFEYDGAGNRVREVDALGRATAFEHDAAGRLVRTVFHDGSTRLYEYDAAGRTVAERDAAGRTTRFAYDANGNVVRVTDPAGGETVFTHDEENHLLSQTDANGHTTSYAYDSGGRLIRTTKPSGAVEVYEYNPGASPVRVVNANGEELRYEYDAAQRLIAKVFPGGERVDIVRTPTGRESAVTDARGTTTYAYDARDRLIRQSNPDGSRLEYTYDAVGNVTSLTTFLPGAATGRVTAYTYDALSRLTGVTDPAGRTTTYAYDQVGNLIQTAYPNGTSTEYGYDDLNRLLTVEHRRGATVLDRFEYSLDAAGSRSRVDALDGSFVEYEYDVLDRLTRETRHDQGGAVVHDVLYTYDAVGNRLTRVLNGGGATVFTYDEDDRLLAAGPVSFTYDAAGNTLSRTEGGQTTEFAYDVENRLLRSTPPSGPSTDYTYDLFGDRVAKSRAGASDRFLVDRQSPTGFSQVVEEYDAAGSPSASYVYGNLLVSQERSGASSFFHRDGTNSTRLLTDAAGASTDRYAFDAFGVELSRTGSTANPVLFAGERFDDETDLYHLRARYYSPETGRFFSVDPFAGDLRDPTSLHRYLYAHVNPVSFGDPGGTASLLLQTAITNALVSFVVTFTADVVFGGKRPGEAVVNALVAAAFGFVSGGAGVAITKSFTGFLAGRSATWVVRYGLVTVSIAAVKAGLATAFSLAQALTDVARGATQPPPSAAEVLWGASIGFVINFVAELFLLRGVVNVTLQGELADTVRDLGRNRSVRKRLEKYVVVDIFDLKERFFNGRNFWKLRNALSESQIKRLALGLLQKVDAKIEAVIKENTESVWNWLRAFAETLAPALIDKSKELVDPNAVPTR